jgi:glycosyltransferase involved in cell wall biosynthesis
MAAREGVTLRVFYLWQFGVTHQRDPKFDVSFRWDTDLVSGYEHEFVPNLACDPGTHHFWGLRNPALTVQLAAWRPDAILLFGYKWATHLRTILWARLHRIPILFRGDSHFLGRERPHFLRRVPLRFLFRQFSACLPVGTANRDYFLALGVPPARLFFAPHAVDDTRFDPSIAEHQAARDRLRSELGLPTGAIVVLYAGKFVPEKQPRELLAAFLAIQDQGAHLVFVGDGPEKAVLIAEAKTANSGRVHFLPFANQSAMPAHLLLADLFVLPSRGVYETWGLAVNEAMHVGVPALVSDRVGCQQDLVTPGETGWVFRHDDRADLRAKLVAALALLRQPAEVALLRARVKDRIERYTYAHAAAGLRAALDYAVSGKGP